MRYSSMIFDFKFLKLSFDIILGLFRVFRFPRARFCRSYYFSIFNSGSHKITLKSYLNSHAMLTFATTLPRLMSRSRNKKRRKRQYIPLRRNKVCHVEQQCRARSRENPQRERRPQCSTFASYYSTKQCTIIPKVLLAITVLEI